MIYSWRAKPEEELLKLSAKELITRLTELRKLELNLDTEIEYTDTVLHSVLLANQRTTKTED